MKELSAGMKIALLIMLISFAYFFCISFMELTEFGKEMAKMITGFLLGSGFGTFINYYWGDSSRKAQGKPPEKLV